MRIFWPKPWVNWQYTCSGGCGNWFFQQGGWVWQLSVVIIQGCQKYKAAGKNCCQLQGCLKVLKYNVNSWVVKVSGQSRDVLKNAIRKEKTKPITKRGNVPGDWFIFLLLLPTPTIWFSPDHKQNVSDRVISGVRRNGNVLILLTLILSRLRFRLQLLFFNFNYVISALTTPLTTPTSTLLLAESSLKWESKYQWIVCALRVIWFLTRLPRMAHTLCTPKNKGIFPH